MRITSTEEARLVRNLLAEGYEIRVARKIAGDIMSGKRDICPDCGGLDSLRGHMTCPYPTD